MSEKQFIYVHEKPNFKDVEEMDTFSADEKEFLEICTGLQEALSGNLHYHPKAFSEDEDVFSCIRCELGDDFEMKIYFRNGVYDSWIFKNNIYRDASNDKDKWKKEKAKEKIAYILEQYVIYEEARYNISKHIDNIYF